MTRTRSFFSIDSDVGGELRACERKFMASIIADVDEITRAAIESVRGSAKAEPIAPADKIVASFRCSVCGEKVHSSSGYVPLFCQRCGRLFDYGEDG